MQNSKLVRLISLLNRKEQKRLDNFLRSPYHVNQKDQSLLSPLYETICRHLFFDSKLTLSKKNVYKYVYPNDVYIKGKLEKLMTKFSKYINHFLELEYHSKTKKKASSYLAQAHFFREKKETKALQIAIKKGRKTQEDFKKKSFSDYYTDFLIEQEYLLFKSHLNNTRGENTNLSNTIKALDIYYLTQRLEYETRIKLQNFYTNSVDKQAFSIKNALVTLTKEEYLKTPLIKAYSYAATLYDNPHQKKINAFKSLSTLLDNQVHNFFKDDIRTLKIMLRTYALTQYDSDKKKYFKKALDLYKEHLEEGSLYYTGKLHSSTFKNIVDLGLELKENKWVYNFLQTHKEKIIGSENIHEVFNFNMANYYFRTNKYEEALNLLNPNYKDIYYKVSAKRLEIKILFEQSSPLLHHRMEAFKVFMFRQNKKTLTESQLKANNNFIDALKKILAPKTLGNLGRIDNLAQRIKDADLVIERKWLLEKLEEQK